MTREQLIECIAKALYRLAWGPTSHWPPHNIATHARFIEKAMAVDAALTAAGMGVVPVERGIGFFDAVERSLIALCEKEHEDQLTREFCAWNKDRRAMTEAANGG